MSEFRGKVAVVTGSSMGIGRQVAELLLQKDAQVVINGRNRQRLDATASMLRESGFEPLAVAADVTNIDDCHRLIEKTISHFGRVDALVNNAGVSMEGELGQLNPDVFRQVVDINLNGSVNATKAALPAIERSGGSILFVSSVAGLSGLPGYSAYSCSKMALTALAQSLRMELHGRGIHIGIAYVGFTQNDPEKQIFSPSGRMVPQPSRNFANAQPVEKVAARLVRMLEKRQFKQVFSPLGKLAAITNWWSPGLMNWFIRRMYIKYELGKTFRPELQGIENPNLTVAR